MDEESGPSWLRAIGCAALFLAIAAGLTFIVAATFASLVVYGAP
jgi:hypothetical protein